MCQMGLAGGASNARGNRSFFSKSRLSLQQWILALFWWVRQYPVGDMAKEAKIEKTNACDVNLGLER